MVGVEGDYAVLDYGAGVCAVCVDDVEAEMRTGNWIGILGLLAFALTAMAEFGSLIIILEVTSLLCFFYAGFRGSRWWFTVPLR